MARCISSSSQARRARSRSPRPLRRNDRENAGHIRKNSDGLLRGQCAKTRDGHINYHLWGRGDRSRPLVVTVHGLMGTMSTFSATAQSLLEAGYDVLTFDLFGFGLSSAPHKRFCARLYVRQTLDLLAHLGYAESSKFSVIGFSMGGLVAMELARAVSKRVSRLLLIAPAGLVPLTRAEEAQINGLRLARSLGIPVASWFGKLASYSTASADYFEPDGDSERALEAARQSARMYNSNPEKFAKSWLKSVRDMRFGGNFEAYAGLAESGVETMFIWGDSDETIPLEVVHDDLRHFFPSAPVRIIQNSGHSLLLDHSQNIASMAAVWFARRPLPSGPFLAYA